MEGREIRENDPDLEGHVPGAPLYPGYAQDECACPAAAALIPMAAEYLPSAPRVVQKIVRTRIAPVPAKR